MVWAVLGDCSIARGTTFAQVEVSVQSDHFFVEEQIIGKITNRTDRTCFILHLSRSMVTARRKP